MANQAKIILEFGELFEQAKSMTELALRAHDNDTIVITDTDKPTLLHFFSEANDDIRNRFFGSVKTNFFEDTIIYELTDELKENDFASAQGLLKKCFVKYMLAEWYNATGQGEWYQKEKTQYEQYGKDLQRTSSSIWFVRPKPKIYF